MPVEPGREVTRFDLCLEIATAINQHQRMLAEDFGCDFVGAAHPRIKLQPDEPDFAFNSRPTTLWYASPMGTPRGIV